MKNICSDISQTTLIDEHSKKIDLLDHTVLPVKFAMRNQELTEIAMENGASKSQLSEAVLDVVLSYNVAILIKGCAHNTFCRNIHSIIRGIISFITVIPQ